MSLMWTGPGLLMKLRQKRTFCGKYHNEYIHLVCQNGSKWLSATVDMFSINNQYDILLFLWHGDKEIHDFELWCVDNKIICIHINT